MEFGGYGGGTLESARDAALRRFPDPVEPEIVMEDGKLLMATKPAGMPCAPLPGRDPEGTLLGWVLRRRPAIGKLRLPNRPPGEGGLVNRLDTATSGLVMFAFDEEVFLGLADPERAPAKLYLARFVRDDRGLPGSIPARHDGAASVIESRFRPWGPGRKRVACLDPRLPAPARAGWTDAVYRSEVACLGAADDGTEACLVVIRRGFRHHIRAHLAWSGRPVAGDAVYSRAGERPRMYLHAYAILLPGGAVPSGLACATG